MVKVLRFVKESFLDFNRIERYWCHYRRVERPFRLANIIFKFSPGDVSLYRGPTELTNIE